jgi:hypothetical protein
MPVDDTWHTSGGGSTPRVTGRPASTGGRPWSGGWVHFRHKALLRGPQDASAVKSCLSRPHSAVTSRAETRARETHGQWGRAPSLDAGAPQSAPVDYAGARKNPFRQLLFLWSVCLCLTVRAPCVKYDVLFLLTSYSRGAQP